jgi:heat shock protein HslJ
VQLTQPQWILAELINDGQTILLSAPERVSIDFEENGSVSGTSTCNLFSSQYTITVEYSISGQVAGGVEEEMGVGGTIAFGQIAQTERACLESELMEEEDNFLRALGQSTQFQVTSETLKLFDSNEPASILVSFEIMR